MSRSKRLKQNTIYSLILEITTIVCGFILPRLILTAFGSETNGLVNSITQFLAIIAFLELGVGAVVQSSLYKPLSDSDNTKVSQIIVSANRFYKTIAFVLMGYVLVLIGIYPFISHSDFSWLFSGTLIAAMSVSAFAQYYFGVVDRLLLTADQRGYIQYNAQSLTLIANTIACFVLIKLESSIQLVKLTTSLIYLLRPLFLRWYVNNHYSIDRKITYEEEPITQKWNGVAQHVAAVVLNNTDNIVLTLFSTLSNVSIYSIYYLVVAGVKQLFTSLTGGIQALLGELWAKKETENLQKTFNWTEWSLHTGGVFVFGCTASLIVPFVKVYTSGVNDANYIVPTFALLLTLANGLHCLRLPYNIMILAVGHYKQTQSNYIIAATLNIIISIIAVNFLGLIGVAIGTLVAMTYQTIWMAWYDSTHLIDRSLKLFAKQMLVDVAVFASAFVVCKNVINGDISNFGQWIILAFEAVAIWFAISLLLNSIFYREQVVTLFRNVKRKLVRS